jgi:hypothetical protein
MPDLYSVCITFYLRLGAGIVRAINGIQVQRLQQQNSAALLTVTK